MHGEINSTINVLPPFKRLCMTIGELPASYLETMTYYETLLWLTKYLQETVIPTINNNAEAVIELQNLYKELQDYVNNYFDNLDVQDEINNKLDAMVEDGTLDILVNNHIKELITFSLDFSKKLELIDDYSNLYNGRVHNYLQGFCEVNGNIVACFYDATHMDDYTYLAEIDPATGNILRSAYLTLYHGNSITYDEENQLLYVASNSKANNGSTSEENSISVVDYTDFTFINYINISNIPNNHRIRSVYYDNENQILYAGDNYDIFKLNIEDEIIEETINLEVITNENYDRNQTYKLWNNMFVGLFMGFIGVWDLTGKLIRVINLNQIQEGYKLGEPEDFFIKENGDIILGCTTKIVNDRKERITSFYKSNMWINNQSSFIPFIVKNTDNPTLVYVDNTSTENYQDGTSSYPYKDLQYAINNAKNLNDYISIHVRGSEYNYCDIVNCNISLVIENNVTIDGLTINYSKVTITPNSNKVLTINGLRCIRSILQFRGNSNNNSIINAFTNENIMDGALSSFTNKAIYSVFSDINIAYCNINGNNEDNACELLQFTTASFEQCRFDEYENNYAINIYSLSKVILNRNTFVIGVSDSQHRIRVADSSILYTQPNLDNVNNYVISYYGKIYGLNTLENNISDTYYGDVCTVNTNYDMMKIKVRIGGLNGSYKYVDIPTNKNEQITIDTIWVNSTGTNINIMNIKIDNGILKVLDHGRVLMTSSGQYNYSTVSNNTPDNTTIYSCIKSIEYYNL